MKVKQLIAELQAIDPNLNIKDREGRELNDFVVDQVDYADRTVDEVVLGFVGD